MTLSASGLRRGYVAAQPLAFGVFVYGVTFGLLARNAGLSIVEALLMSATVYSGSAQTATVSGIAADSRIGASVVTMLMLNARYLLYGAALRPWLGAASIPQAYSSLYLLGDSNWVPSMKARAQGESDSAFVFGSGIAMFLPWLGGTLHGSIANEWVADPKVLGLDLTIRLELLPLFLAVTLAAFACRAGGFWLMRFVVVTPRVQAR
ncbi:MAG TPA: AzlC family ABC transporter permease [Burkholderiaceae bacterium]|nr:AzlC family ABC transporter permease [Burkholderiaceae bacterium]